MALADPARAGAIISEALANHKSKKRHPAEVTSDRLGEATKAWPEHFTPGELDMIATIRYRLQNIAETGPLTAPGRPRNTGLSQREHQVATMVLDGLSTTTIAGRLNIATRTVGNTLSRVYAKLGITGRDQLARHHLDKRT